MNKAQFKKSVGTYLQLRPVPRTRDGRVVDDDWILRSVGNDRFELENRNRGYTAILGLDHVYSFLTNPARNSGQLRYGFLLLHVQLILDGTAIYLEPSPPPRAPAAEKFFHPHSFHPLIVKEEGYLRYFSWRGRDPTHLITFEDEPRQLLTFYITLCDTLRRESGMEPEFNLPQRIQGEVVYELSPDFRAKWRLLGGMGGAPANQVLVLVPRR